MSDSRAEPDALVAQDLAQLAVVVQLAVVAQVQAVLDERLVRRGRQVDDRQPPMRKLQWRVSGARSGKPSGVRPAVADAIGHRLYQPSSRPAGRNAPATPHMSASHPVLGRTSLS